MNERLAADGHCSYLIMKRHQSSLSRSYQRRQFVFRPLPAVVRWHVQLNSCY